MKFKQDKFNEWSDIKHIPEKVMDMVKFIAEKIGYGDCIEEETITMRNRGGYPYAYAKGFTISHCTFSYLNGPSADYSKEFTSFLKGLGFRIENSYGDNGMDSETNWQDTYWYYDFVYEPSIVYADEFEVYEESDYEY